MKTFSNHDNNRGRKLNLLSEPWWGDPPRLGPGNICTNIHGQSLGTTPELLLRPRRLHSDVRGAARHRRGGGVDDGGGGGRARAGARGAPARAHRLLVQDPGAQRQGARPLQRARRLHHGRR